MWVVLSGHPLYIFESSVMREDISKWDLNIVSIILF